MTDTSQTNPHVIVLVTPDQSLDLSGVNDTAVLAIGAAEQIDLVGISDEDDEGSGDTVVLTGYESGVTIGSSDGVELGVGQNDIQLLGYRETVTGQAYPGSNDFIEVNGKDDALELGGYNNVVLNGTDSTVTIEPTLIADSYDPFGQNRVVANGVGKDTVTGGGADFTFTGGSERYLIEGGSAENTTISGGAGGGLFVGGYFYRPDYLSFPYYSGNNVITAGHQASTLIGGLHGQSLLIADGSARDVLIAGEYGNDTLSGGTSTGDNIYEGYNGNFVPSDDPVLPSLVIDAGSGNDTLVASLCAETMIGGTGRDQFRFFSDAGGETPFGGDRTVIMDFTKGLDKIDLRGFNATSEQLVENETVSNGSTYLSLPDGEKITLLNITDLSPKDFTRS